MPWTKNDVERHKKGLTDTQKKGWVRIANSALESCLEKGDKPQSECEASAIRQANGVVGNSDNAQYAAYNVQANNYNIRTEVLEGKEHLVVPVVMMVEGVHNGSHGPLLHKIEELGKWPESWNGIPVSVPHPEKDGQIVSCNSPAILEQFKTGRVFNTHVEGTKLKGEAWLEKETLLQKFPLAYSYISEKKPLEVSIGTFTDDEMVEGIWGGEKYAGIAHNHRPDHLALLPGGTGACSWADGAGVRANQAKKEGGGQMENIIKIIKELIGKGYTVQANELSFTDISQKIQIKLDRMDDDLKTHFIQEVYDDYFIYQVSIRSGENTVTPNDINLYKRTYQINEDESIEFTGEAMPVIKKVEYVQTNESLDGKEVTTMEKKGMKEKVDMLINSKHTTFEEADREYLESVPEEHLDKMVTMEKPVEVVKEVEVNKEMDKEQAIQVLQDHMSDPEKAIAMFPDEIQDQMRSGLNLHRERKQKLVEAITANTDAYTADELKEMSMGALEKLGKAVIKAPVDYSALGAGGGLNPQANTVQPMIPPNIEKSEGGDK